MRCALTWWGGLRPLIYTIKLGPQSVVVQPCWAEFGFGVRQHEFQNLAVQVPLYADEEVWRPYAQQSGRSTKGRQLTQTANKDEPFLSEKNPTPVIQISLQCGHEEFCPS